MQHKDLEQSLIDEIRKDNERPDNDGHYHPSQVTGCPLQVTLDKMTDNKTILNCWLFQGTAVHHWLQQSGVLSRALHEAGYHMIDISYEIRTHTKIADGVYLTGQCDVIASDGDKRHIFDIKYSSIRPSSGAGRLYKYFSQANVYSYMFDADEYGLIMINSRSRDLLGVEDGKPDIFVLDNNEPDEENWEMVKRKCINIEELLTNLGYYDGRRISKEELESYESVDWQPFYDQFHKETMPAYNKECSYCDHSDYCPVKNGKVSTGLNSFRGGV